MSEYWFRMSHCEGKKSLPGYRQARAIADRMGGASNPYRCKICGGWHVGDNSSYTKRLDSKRYRRRKGRGKRHEVRL